MATRKVPQVNLLDASTVSISLLNVHQLMLSSSEQKIGAIVIAFSTPWSVFVHGISGDIRPCERFRPDSAVVTFPPHSLHIRIRLVARL